MQKQYPMGVKLEVYITDGDQVGSVNYGYGFGGVPSDEEMDAVLGQVKEALPNGFRLMNRAEATMHFMREECGYRGPDLAVPHDPDKAWHDPSTDVSISGTGSSVEDEDEE